MVEETQVLLSFGMLLGSCTKIIWPIFLQNVLNIGEKSSIKQLAKCVLATNNLVDSPEGVFAVKTCINDARLTKMGTIFI